MDFPDLPLPADLIGPTPMQMLPGPEMADPLGNTRDPVDLRKCIFMNIGLAHCVLFLVHVLSLGQDQARRPLRASGAMGSAMPTAPGSSSCRAWRPRPTPIAPLAATAAVGRRALALTSPVRAVGRA